jgi:hypothetical protein
MIMAIHLSVENYKRLSRVESQLCRTQARYWKEDHNILPENWALFVTNGPRQPHHHPTPPMAILELAQKIEKELPPKNEIRLGIAGSGLGISGFSFASLTGTRNNKAVFGNILGMEIDPVLQKAAEDARKAARFNNLSFEHSDFLRSHKAYEFNMIYFYYPFASHNYGRLMNKWLSTALSGTIVMSYIYDNKDVGMLQRSQFRPLLRRSEIMTSEGPFFVHRRK